MVAGACVARRCGAWQAVVVRAKQGEMAARKWS